MTTPIINETSNAYDYRWRVIQVLTMDENSLYARRVPKEFKSAATAQRYADRIARDGFPVAIQLGKIHWFTEEERDEEVSHLPTDKSPNR